MARAPWLSICGSSAASSVPLRRLPHSSDNTVETSAPRYRGSHPPAHKLTRLRHVHAAIGRLPLIPAEFVAASDGLASLPPDRQGSFTDALSASQSRGTLAEYVDHIDYVVKRIGWRHVGIGTDFDHGAGVTGFDSEGDAPNVTRELVRRGYTEQQIAGIWGGNFLRVLSAAEAAKTK